MSNYLLTKNHSHAILKRTIHDGLTHAWHICTIRILLTRLVFLKNMYSLWLLFHKWTVNLLGKFISIRFHELEVIANGTEVGDVCVYVMS